MATQAMTVNSQLLKDAVAIESTLRRAGEWLSCEQLQLGLNSRRQYKAMRFLILHGLVEARIFGEGAGRYKAYHAPRITPLKPVGFPKIVLPPSQAVPQNAEVTINELR